MMECAVAEDTNSSNHAKKGNERISANCPNFKLILRREC